MRQGARGASNCGDLREAQAQAARGAVRAVAVRRRAGRDDGGGARGAPGERRRGRYLLSLFCHIYGNPHEDHDVAFVGAGAQPWRRCHLGGTLGQVEVQAPAGGGGIVDLAAALYHFEAVAMLQFQQLRACKKASPDEQTPAAPRPRPAPSTAAAGQEGNSSSRWSCAAPALDAAAATAAAARHEPQCGRRALPKHAPLRHGTRMGCLCAPFVRPLYPHVTLMYVHVALCNFM